MPHILFIDDHEMLLQSLRLTLEPEYEVSLASSVPEAFALMALSMPDVIGVDYLMPDLNGIDFLEMLRGVGDTGGVCNTPLRAHRYPKVIFFSGALSDRLVAEALRAGAAACLAKPFGIEELKAMVAKVLEM